MTYIRKRSGKFGLGALSSCVIFIFAVALWLTCNTVPDYCGDGELYDPSCQYCIDGKVYVGCPDGSKVPFGTQCGVITPPDTGTAVYAVEVSSEGTDATGGGEYPQYAMVTVTAGTPPSGYRFKEWTSSVNGVTFVPDANNATVLFAMPACSVTVTAVFEAIPVAVRYAVLVSSAGTGATGSGEYPPNDTVRVTAGTPLSGYQFTKWTSSVDSVTFVPGANNDTVTFRMPACSVTVTAVFEAIAAAAPRITFNPGSGGTVSPASRAADTAGKLASLPVPTKTGYGFLGWFFSADTGGTRVDTGTVFGADTVIYARWVIETYTLTYDLNGGTVSPPANPTSYTVETDTFTLKNPTKTGYKFSGWTGVAGTMDTVVTVAKGSTGPKIYTANWFPTPYTITYNLNGGTVSPANANPVSYNIETPEFTLKNPAKPDSVFAGWTGTNGTTPQKIVTVTIGNTGNRNYTANWSDSVSTDSVVATYTLTVEKNPALGGSVTPTTRPGLHAGDTVNVSATASSGYMFKKWTISGSGSTIGADSVSPTTVTVNGNVTVTANFIQTGRVPDDSVEYNDKKYPTVVIGGKTWMAENMNFDTASSWCYGDSVNNNNCVKYGRLYDWDMAIAVCPTGWRLPDTADWNHLAAAVGGTSVAGGKLKSVSGWESSGGIANTDNFGFSALPGGVRDSAGAFNSVGRNGHWWTAAKSGSGGHAYFMSMSYDADTLVEGHDYEGAGFSVRCVKD
ncbi:MAG: InlB B-repeat-containing protein [Chitinispirillales bacterium]|jgi:uncharacterized protein (TIGR02145 family)/uncharacterized repeat protein (TIGR02543 family)|nr:InlB B-repeat-containing protein [Chitinispirillales bacterium]